MNRSTQSSFSPEPAAIRSASTLSRSNASIEVCREAGAIEGLPLDRLDPSGGRLRARAAGRHRSSVRSLEHSRVPLTYQIVPVAGWWCRR
jgi:hypothetical protein